MIGIDIARIKRWYAKTYPTYATTAYKIVVTDLTQDSQDSIDTLHGLDGVELDFTVTAYDVSTNTVVAASGVTGRYSRRHYGGWECGAGSSGT